MREVCADFGGVGGTSCDFVAGSWVMTPEAGEEGLWLRGWLLR